MTTVTALLALRAMWWGHSRAQSWLLAMTLAVSLSSCATLEQVTQPSNGRKASLFLLPQSWQKEPKRTLETVTRWPVQWLTGQHCLWVSEKAHAKGPRHVGALEACTGSPRAKPWALEGNVWRPSVSAHVTPAARESGALWPPQAPSPCLLPRTLPRHGGGSSPTHVFVSCQVGGDEVSMKP